ncbi:hypothetical protein FQ192_27750 [Pseudomonas sp. ANT_J12]|nr:hypothetical protein FQ192_27750 [Pseudomonas sp. ANT_J12]
MRGADAGVRATRRAHFQPAARRRAQSHLIDRSHAPRGNASCDALRHIVRGRGASRAAFPRGAWERSSTGGKLRL